MSDNIEFNNYTEQFGYYLQKANKNLYKEILKIAEDIFFNEIECNEDKWQRFRKRILDVGNNNGRLLESLVDVCEIKPKKFTSHFVSVDGKMVKK